MILLIIPQLLRKGFNGITIFPFIVLKNKSLKQNKTLINHERIHLRQQLELLVLPFYVWYLIEYTIRLIQYKNRFLAYKNISFEREAYANETNLEYLKTRRFWVFLRYIRLK